LKHGAGDWENRKIKLSPSTDLSRCELWNLVDASSICALQLLKVDLDLILYKDPSTWEEHQSYKDAVAFVASISVVNDMAERAIKLITECNSHKRTKNEAELQKIVQSIEDNRKRLSSVSKSAVSEYRTR
jgi:hypothetical protein